MHVIVPWAQTDRLSREERLQLIGQSEAEMTTTVAPVQPGRRAESEWSSLQSPGRICVKY